jgi:hypothetical protein
MSVSLFQCIFRRMHSQRTFQLQIEYCEIDMNTLHSYEEGRERERERERDKQTRKILSTQIQSSAWIGLSSEKFKWTINFAKTTYEKQTQYSASTLSHSSFKSSLPGIFRTNATHFQGPMTLLLNVRLSYNIFISVLKLILLRLPVVLPSPTANVAYNLTLLTQLSKFRHNASSKYKIQQNSELNPNAHAISFAAYPKSPLLHPYTLHFRKFYLASSLNHKH